MVLTTSCCLNPRPLTAPLTTTQPLASAREVSWRNQCAVGVVCMMISLQIEGVVGNRHDYALAIEPKDVIESKVKAKRWSGKRMCPAWQLNSLETIVPEDLPRPSSKRKWEGVSGHLRVAPPVKSFPTTITAASSDCFSM
ncbi:protein CHLOROPLAST VESICULATION [Rutidosis leptorrhynchoides]|uniref:protein CHLOROPLAST VESICULATION n=1 Tax=Rutidosis leptorrhynchoides TaxID=125765 RepID=UPI003A9A408D